MSRVLVTGASGFVGAALTQAFAAEGRVVRAAYRAAQQEDLNRSEAVVVGALGAETDWRAALEGVDAVVHLAGPAHAKFAQAYLQAAIVEGAATLAAKARERGVSRFIYVSSIKAACSRTQAGSARPGDPPHPGDPYGRAKRAAEVAVLAHADIRPVVLRPPLVHAAHAKANFRSLLKLAATPAPLPLAGIANRRSVIALPSLIAAIRAVLDRPDGPAGVFHVADSPALSTTEIVSALRAGMGRPAALFSAPGVSLVLPRALTESLEVDASQFATAYGWSAADSRAALAETGAAWTARR